MSKIPAVYLDRSQDFGTFSQEIRFNSPRDKKFNYVTGLYYVNENISGNDIGVTQEFLRVIEDEPERFPQIDPDYSLVQQLHRLEPAQIREIARGLGRGRGLLR